MEKNSNQKILSEIREERTRLIAELFSNPSKQKRTEIEKKIIELDKRYMEVFE